MRAFLRFAVLALILGGTLTGCSTPSKRARQQAAAYRRLSPSDQKLVLGGRVRPGLSQAGVYIAWGEPDEKHTESGGKDGLATETWVYRQRITLWEPINSYDFFGPFHGYGGLPAGRPPRPGFGIGGIGYEGPLELQPHVRSLDHLRVAVFSGGKVDRYKTARHDWIAAPRPASPPAPTLIPAGPSYRLNRGLPARASAPVHRLSLKQTGTSHGSARSSVTSHGGSRPAKKPVYGVHESVLKTGHGRSAHPAKSNTGKVRRARRSHKTSTGPIPQPMA